MKLKKTEADFLKKISKNAFKLAIELCHNPAYAEDIDTAESLEEKGLCNTTYSVSKGFSASINEAGAKALETL
jgi:hypothetical protein